MRRLSPFSFALLALLALPAGCSRVSVDWSAKPREITLEARGFTNAYLLVLTGTPAGPLLRREAPAAWATVGPTAGRMNVEVLRVPFDDRGNATATIGEGQAPSGTLVQALVLSASGDGMPLGSSDCMAVTWKDGVPSLRHHALDVAFSPVGVRILGVLLAVVACFFLARLRFQTPVGRGVRITIAFLIAGALLLARALAPAPVEGVWSGQPPPPLWPPPPPPGKELIDPMDRIAVPGFRELVDRARAAIPTDGSIAIRPKNEFGEASREAWEASWLLWPRRPEILKHDADPLERRGFYIILGEAANPKSARVVFKNRAGALWHVAEGEPR